MSEDVSWPKAVLMYVVALAAVPVFWALRKLGIIGES